MILELDGVTHEYGTESAVSDVSFGLDNGELVALLGPSGCGKTTLVQAIAGHIGPTAGRVFLRGTDVTDSPPEQRRVGIVFQRSTLYPHMTVRENVAYGLDARDIDPDRRDETVATYLDLVELTARGDSYPEELSGGEQRRVELARALAPEPDVLLLDEPLSSLDRTLRDQLQAEIARIQRETGVTTLFVTHDQEEAMALADRIVILRDGTVSAIGEPRTLYESPPNRFVASFLGRSNTLPVGTVITDLSTLEGDSKAEQVVHVRPEDVVIDPANGTERALQLRGTVQSVRDIGRRYDVHLRLDSGVQLIAEERGSPPAVNEDVVAAIDERDITILGRSDSDGR